MNEIEINVEGMDRLAAQELKELFDADGQSDALRIEQRKNVTGRSEALDGVIAVVSNANVPMLLLVGWILANKKLELTFTSKGKKFHFEYEQSGAKDVLKFLKNVFDSQ